MQNRKIDKSINRQICIDEELHQKIKELAARQKKSIKKLVEECLSLVISKEY